MHYKCLIIACQMLYKCIQVPKCTTLFRCATSSDTSPRHRISRIPREKALENVNTKVTTVTPKEFGEPV